MEQFTPDQMIVLCRRCTKKCDKGHAIPRCGICASLNTNVGCGSCRGIVLTTKCKFREVVINE